MKSNLLLAVFAVSISIASIHSSSAGMISGESFVTHNPSQSEESTATEPEKAAERTLSSDTTTEKATTVENKTGENKEHGTFGGNFRERY